MDGREPRLRSVLGCRSERNGGVRLAGSSSPEAWGMGLAGFLSGEGGVVKVRGRGRDPQRLLWASAQREDWRKMHRKMGSNWGEMG